MSEEDADVEMCIALSDIPSEGIDLLCAIEVTINFTRVSTCKLYVQSCLQTCDSLYEKGPYHSKNYFGVISRRL